MHQQTEIPALSKVAVWILILGSSEVVIFCHTDIQLVSQSTLHPTSSTLNYSLQKANANIEENLKITPNRVHPRKIPGLLDYGTLDISNVGSITMIRWTRRSQTNVWKFFWMMSLMCSSCIGLFWFLLCTGSPSHCLHGNKLKKQVTGVYCRITWLSGQSGETVSVIAFKW